MRSLVILTLASIVAASGAAAQQTPSPAASPPPDKQPFTTPYGLPIGLSRAENAIAAAIAESVKRGWTMTVAVVDSGSNLVALSRMDDAQLASIEIAEHKARAAARFRRPTRTFEEAARAGAGVLSLDGAIASAGGVPLIDNGKLIGAIGCSGGASAQDEAICLAGAATINSGGN